MSISKLLSFVEKKSMKEEDVLKKKFDSEKEKLEREFNEEVSKLKEELSQKYSKRKKKKYQEIVQNEKKNSQKKISEKHLEIIKKIKLEFLEKIKEISKEDRNSILRKLLLDAEIKKYEVIECNNKDKDFIKKEIKSKLKIVQNNDICSGFILKTKEGDKSLNYSFENIAEQIFNNNLAQIEEKIQ